ncbi:peptidylprolyl isomerase [Marinobacter sp.]|uniref:peptidylprolyl isomerase n=1 Tax=Marinobacter sp. TaxID=50741 RepID=UPI00384FE4C5
MKNLIPIVYFGILLAATSTLQAEQKPFESREKTGEQEVFVTVNGTPLAMNLYQFLLGSRQQDSTERQSFDNSFDAELHRQQAAKDLVMTELLAQQATQLGMQESELVKVEMAMAEKTLLAQLYVRKLMDSIDIGEAEIRQYYDQQNEQAMYRFMIWRTSDEDHAVEILNTLKAGKGADISDQDIIETPWLRDADIAPEVNDIVRQMGVNDFAEKPVFQDGFWKVIQVIDRQTMARQSYEEEREMIRAELASVKLDEKLEELAEGASIVFNDVHVTQPVK